MIVTRANTDINRIMIHHTDTDPDVYGKDVNTIFMRNQQFGAPYDILINHDGKIDISSRWAFGVRPENYFEDIHVQNIAKRYPKHLLSAAGVTYESNLHDVHVAVVGNFDNTIPTNFQLNVLQQVLEVLKRDIPTITDVLYHDDEANTTCPGRMFFNKSTLSISDGFSKDYLKSDPINLIPEKPFEFTTAQVNEVMGSDINIPIYHPSIHVADFYSEIYKTDPYPLSNGGRMIGQSFIGDGSVLTSCKFYLGRINSPPGFCTAQLYAHSGIYGVSSVGIGDALAISDGVLASSLIYDTTFYMSTFALATFSFSTPYTLVAGTPYVIMYSYADGNPYNYTYIGYDKSKNFINMGNWVQFGPGDWPQWGCNSNYATCFYVNGLK